MHPRTPTKTLLPLLTVPCTHVLSLVPRGMHICPSPLAQHSSHAYRTVRTSMTNSFDNLRGRCINLANERLQAIFMDSLIKRQLAEYKREGISCAPRPADCRHVPPSHRPCLPRAPSHRPFATWRHALLSPLLPYTLPPHTPLDVPRWTCLAGRAPTRPICATWQVRAYRLP